MEDGRKVAAAKHNLNATKKTVVVIQWMTDKRTKAKREVIRRLLV